MLAALHSHPDAFDIDRGLLFGFDHSSVGRGGNPDL